MTTDMHVRIGSLTKMYTGTMVMQQIEAGKLSLDDPISKYVPGIPNGDKVTMQGLLGIMQSGAASYSTNREFTKTLFDHPETVVYTPDQLIGVWCRQVTGLPAGREVRSHPQHQHAAARQGPGEGHRQAARPAVPGPAVHSSRHDQHLGPRERPGDAEPVPPGVHAAGRAAAEDARQRHALEPVLVRGCWRAHRRRRRHAHLRTRGRHRSGRDVPHRPRRPGST